MYTVKMMISYKFKKSDLRGQLNKLIQFEILIGNPISHIKKKIKFT